MANTNLNMKQVYQNHLTLTLIMQKAPGKATEIPLKRSMYHVYSYRIIAIIISFKIRISHWLRLK